MEAGRNILFTDTGDAKIHRLLRTLKDRYKVLADADEDGFHVLIDASPLMDVARPLLVLVHPGDAVEKRGDVMDFSPSERQEVLNYSMACQEGMGKEMLGLMTRADAVDFVVVHRASTHYSFQSQSNVSDDYYQAITRIEETGTVLWGDDLDAVADWIDDNLRAHERPLVIMTGAYSHEHYGCVTSIGLSLQLKGAPVQLSEYSNVDRGPDEDRWRPHRGMFHGLPVPTSAMKI